ncbi:DUF2065 domain-containing protein [Frigidibacter sp. RF13]|uniref:DUF2065 domain-containing protein n=1 Tax=Frigidibacter sp. RF13 TaxID=2997340 RepID=UPI00226DC24F|nr:DUF2065 domain-containing protein [Frigidibacter sp. RF13]MCY1126935.1 DUF2065 domain-containing protein [Frigidibacter sp. RF13]
MGLGPTEIGLALGLLCVAEGLVLALAPRKIEEILALLAKVSVENRRLMGLAAIAAGVATIWLIGLAGG